MKIYIPTKDRIEDQKTWEHIPERWKQHTFLVCPQNEVREHEARGRNAIAHPKSTKGISAVRQWIIENSKDKTLVQVDDDHWFFRRISPDSVKLRKCAEEDLLELFDWMEENTLKFAHVGVSARQGNHLLDYPHVEVTRVNNMHGYYVPVFKHHNLKFTDVPLMEDYHITLSLLKLGYANRVNTEFVWNQSRGSGAQGGCSSYRNADLQTEAAYKLAKLHHPFVKVVEKKSKSGWEGLETRTDVRIQWKKAYESFFNEECTSGAAVGY